MGFRFQRRIKIMPGVTLNVGKRGVSTSIGRRGAHITFGQNGVRTTVGIPGTGISYTSLSKPSHAPEAGSREASWPHLAKCPYCGHGMRKRWDRCPACHQVLEQQPPEGAVRCRGCGRVYEGNMLRFCPACGCRLLDTPVEILPELTAEERAQYAAGHCEVCPHCRGPVPDVVGLKYCPHCGFEVSTKKNRQAFWGKFFYCLFVAILMIGLFVMM